MNWRTEWRAISDRITGLVDAATVYFQALKVSNSDGYAVRRKHLLPEARDIYARLRDYSDRHSAQLPVSASAALQRFLSTHQQLFSDTNLDNFEAVAATVTFLAGFRAEMQFQLADMEAASFRLVERAFIHLQRQLVADEEYREKWVAAFEAGEAACERLGSVHLLQHGIWAFKASAQGERTDLVLAEPLRDLDTVAGAAEVLVLTEWKLVRSPSELQAQWQQAKRQAALYAKGSLAGVELSSYRYLVIVSLDRLTLPADANDAGVLYRGKNIAVRPSSPSRRQAP